MSSTSIPDDCCCLLVVLSDRKQKAVNKGLILLLPGHPGVCFLFFFSKLLIK